MSVFSLASRMPSSGRSFLSFPKTNAQILFKRCHCRNNSFVLETRTTPLHRFFNIRCRSVHEFTKLRQNRLGKLGRLADVCTYTIISCSYMHDPLMTSLRLASNWRSMAFDLRFEVSQAIPQQWLIQIHLGDAYLAPFFGLT